MKIPKQPEKPSVTDLDDSLARRAPTSETADAASLVQPGEGTISFGGQAGASCSKTPPPDIAGYVILKELGRGGMGVVYQARQKSLNRLVALKIILGGTHAGPDRHQRFLREAEVVAHLNHPNIVQIFETGEYDGVPYFALEFLDGGSLSERLDRQPQIPKVAARLVEQIARGVDCAHRANILHRDLKPANILLGNETPMLAREPSTLSSSTLIAANASFLPKITDFGLAKLLEESEGNTQTGDVMGTPSYMSPEQAAGDLGRIGPAADIYSLGAILYEAVTGKPPFKAATPLETIRQVLDTEPVGVRQLQPQTPRDLETICHKCLHKDPKRRYRSAEDLAEDLRRFQAGEPILARPVGQLERTLKWARRRPASAALVLVSVLSLVALFGGGAWFTAELAAETDQAIQAKKDADIAKKTADDLAVKEGEAKVAAQKAKVAAEEANLLTGKALTREKVALKQVVAEKERIEELLYSMSLGRAWGDWQLGNAASAQAALDACRPEFRGLEHALLKTYFAKFVQHLPIEKAVIFRKVLFSPDGRWIAAAGDGGVILVWDSKSRKIVIGPSTIPGGPEGETIAFSPDGGLLAVGKQAALRLWSLPAGKPYLPEEFKGTAHAIVSLAFDATGEVLASASSDSIVRQWDIKTGKILPVKYQGHKQYLNNVTLQPTGRLALSSGSLGDVHVWNRDTGKLENEFEIPLKPLYRVAWNPDGKLVAAINGSADIGIWDPLNAKELRKLSGHLGQVVGIAFDRTGERLASASHDKTVRIWQTATGKLQHTLRGHLFGSSSVAFSPDGQTLVSTGPDKTVKMWNLESLDDRPKFKGLDALPAATALSPDGGRVALGFAPDYQVKIWDLTPGSEPIALAEPIRGLSELVFSADSSRLATTTDAGAIKVWDTRTGKAVAQVKTALSTLR